MKNKITVEQILADFAREIPVHAIEPGGLNPELSAAEVEARQNREHAEAARILISRTEQKSRSDRLYEEIINQQSESGNLIR